jgi:DNA-binding protein YbaB
MTESWGATDDVVHRMREQLDRLRDSAIPPATTAAAEPITGEAEALDGAVSVEVTGGRVSGLHIDRSALRLTEGELADAIMEATNAALDAVRTAMAESAPTPPSLDEMSSTLNEISAESQRVMSEAAEGARRSMEAIQRISELHRRQR